MKKETLFQALQNTEEIFVKEANETKKPVNWKAWGALAACFAVAVAAVFAVPALKKPAEEPQEEEPPMIGNVMIPNPFVDCDTMEAAAEKAGFTMSAPETVGAYTARTIRVMAGSMIEVQYRQDGAPDYYDVRKALGDEPRHGDYNVYTEEHAVTVGETNVTMKGNDGKVSLAYWLADGYALSVSAAEPITVDAMTEIVKNVK